MESGHQWCSWPLISSWFHSRDVLLWLALQSRSREQKKWQVESLHWLYQSQWNLPEGQLSPFEDLSTGKGDGGLRAPCFMDAYSMYNQIKMYPLDEDKTDFTLGRGIYCYKVMPFILKNAGASLRFGEWLTKSSRTLPWARWYVGEKCTSHGWPQHVDKTFDFLRQYKVKLNLEKGTFGWLPGSFFGYLIT